MRMTDLSRRDSVKSTVMVSLQRVIMRTMDGEVG